MPGIGAQGGSLEAIAVAADSGGVGAYAASSRGVIYPYQPEELSGSDWPALLSQRVADWWKIHSVLPMRRCFLWWQHRKMHNHMRLWRAGVMQPSAWP
ncbi:MAG: hypothetical protein G8237_03805 [Magnetococcales bacterium]|nr:hypothetical protein [Magnetococcales bacterium]